MTDQTDQTILTGIETVDRRALAAMIGVEEKRSPEWKDADLAAMLSHQLATPLEHDLAVLGADAGEMLKRILAESNQTLRSFGDVLASERPPLELLTMIKDYVRMGCRDAQLPHEVSTVLYFASIVAAEACHRTHITQLSMKEVIEGARWALGLRWIGAGLRDQLNKGLLIVQK